MRDRRKEVVSRLLGLDHPVSLGLQSHGRGMPLECQLQHGGGDIERAPVILRYLSLPVKVVKRDAAPGLPVAVHDDGFNRARRTIGRYSYDGLPLRVIQHDEVVGILHGRDIELVERTFLAAAGTFLRFAARIQYAMVAVYGMDHDVIASGQHEQPAHRQIDQSRNIVLRQGEEEQVAAKALMRLYLIYQRALELPPVLLVFVLSERDVL